MALYYDAGEISRKISFSTSPRSGTAEVRKLVVPSFNISQSDIQMVFSRDNHRCWEHPGTSTIYSSYILCFAQGHHKWGSCLVSQLMIMQLHIHLFYYSTIKKGQKKRDDWNLSGQLQTMQSFQRIWCNQMSKNLTTEIKSVVAAEKDEWQRNKHEESDTKNEAFNHPQTLLFKNIIKLEFPLNNRGEWNQNPI